MVCRFSKAAGLMCYIVHVGPEVQAFADRLRLIVYTNSLGYAVNALDVLKGIDHVIAAIAHAHVGYRVDLC